MTFTGSGLTGITLTLVLLTAGCSGPKQAGVPEDVIRQNTLGTAYLGQQEWDSAAGAFRGGLTLRPEDPLLLTNLAVALLQAGTPEAAEAELRKALAADPGYAYAHYNLGLIESNRGNFDAAATHFETVAAFDPDDILTQYHLGTTYQSLARDADAIAALRRALELDPDHVSSLYALGRALVAQGQRDEGRELITRSQTIRARSGLDVAVGSQYGEQGNYALGIDYPGDALAAPAPADVTFVAAAELPLGPARAWTTARQAPDGEAVVIVAEGTSLGRLSVGGGAPAVLGPHPGGGEVLALASGDGDNDTIVELYALVGGPDVPARLAVIEQSESGTLSWADAGLVTGENVLPATVSAANMLLVDREHDGDLDLLFCWAPSAASSCALATNNGAGAFDVAPSTVHGFDLRLGDAGATRLALSDFDNDRDIDFVVSAGNGVHVLDNQRDGTFAAVGDAVGLGTRAAGMSDTVLADLNKDGWMDLVAGGDNGLSIYVNRRGKFADAARLAGHTSAVASLAVFDADNDGFLDVAAWGPESGTVAYRNAGAGEWQPAPGWFGDDAGVTVAAAFDGDNDGDLDLAGAAGDAVTVLRNDGGNTNRWISVESRGVGDNKFGVGSKVEVLAGALRQKFEVTGPLPVHAGLGTREQVDSVRHLWPSGVLQDEVEQAAGTRPEITQLDRKGTSCPILYAWRDGRWEFVTDFLGGSAIGYQLAEGVFNTPDTDEYIKLQRAPTVDADGTIRLRVNNQLQEIIWFDQLELIAVDHPAGTELYPNERLMPGPPFPQHELFVSSDVRPIVTATDIEDGISFTAELRDADGVYVENFDLAQFKGYADMHTLELDLGSFDNDERIVMLLDGWIDYADSTANVAASQAGMALMPPELTVADGQGGWRDTGHLMGFPAGLPKTMAVDLSGLFESDDHRVRIRTNMRIYWDRARVMVGGADTAYSTHRLVAESAELGFGGFPFENGRGKRSPKSYNPAIVSEVSPWNVHVGRYTAFGDVTSLVAEIDDRLVTTRSGDEIELRFRSPGPVADGYVRTYLMFADGFGKDMDPNSASDFTVGPMPFHGMPSYPYPDSVEPPVDLSDTLTRTVFPSDRGWHGAVPQAVAPARAETGISVRADDSP